jgi:CheY-like chemotaxis protein
MQMENSNGGLGCAPIQATLCIGVSDEQPSFLQGFEVFTRLPYPGSLVTVFRAMVARAVSILLVEDNDVDAFVFRRSVRQLHCSINHVRDIQIAIEKLEGDSALPHLIVLKMGLPRMSATEFLSWRTNAKAEIQRIPLVMYTGLPMIRDGEEVTAKGSFYKSSSPSEIRTMVEQMCAFEK